MIPQNIKSWKEVVGSPEYHALSPEDQANAKQEYFNSVVAPGVDPAEVEAARSEFMNDLSDPGSQLAALSENVVGQAKGGQPGPDQAQPKGDIFSVAGLPGAAAALPGAMMAGKTERIMGKNLDAVQNHAQFAGQVAGGAMGGFAGGVAGGTVGRAVSELTGMIRGQKPFSYDDFSRELGHGALESLAGEVGGKVLGFLGKFKPLARAGGALVGGYLGAKAGEKAPIPEAGKGVSKVAGALAGATAGAIGPKKLIEIGTRVLGGVSRFAAERIAQRGADVVLDDQKMNPGFFAEVASKAGDIFDQLKTQAYNAFEKTADKIKWNPNLKFDVSPIQKDLRDHLTKLGVLDKAGMPVAVDTDMFSASPQSRELLEIYKNILGSDFGKFPKKFMSFQDASRLMNYLENAIPDAGYGAGGVSKVQTPFVAALQNLRGQISKEMQNANPVLKKAFEEYRAFAEMRESVYPILRNEATAEGKIRNMISGKHGVERQAFEGMLKLHPQGQQILDDLYDASAAKEFYNFTVGGKAGVGKEAAENIVRGAGAVSKVARPVASTAKKTAKAVAPAGLGALFGSMEGKDK
jgi:hypothetical protein